MMEVYNPFQRCPICDQPSLRVTPEGELVCSSCGTSLGYFYPEIKANTRGEALAVGVGGHLRDIYAQILKVCEILHLPSPVAKEAWSTANRLLKKGVRVRKEGLVIFSVLMASRSYGSIRRLDEILDSLKKAGYEVPKNIFRILTRLVIYYGKPLLIPSPVLYARQITSRLASDGILDQGYAEKLFRKTMEVLSSLKLSMPSTLMRATIAILVADLILKRKLTPSVLSEYSGYATKTIRKHLHSVLGEGSLLLFRLSEAEVGRMRRQM